MQKMHRVRTRNVGATFHLFGMEIVKELMGKYGKSFRWRKNARKMQCWKAHHCEEVFEYHDSISATNYVNDHISTKLDSEIAYLIHIFAK